MRDRSVDQLPPAHALTGAWTCSPLVQGTMLRQSHLARPGKNSLTVLEGMYTRKNSYSFYCLFIFEGWISRYKILYRQLLVFSFSICRILWPFISAKTVSDKKSTFIRSGIPKLMFWFSLVAFKIFSLCF